MNSPFRGFLTSFRVQVQIQGNLTGVGVQVPPRTQIHGPDLRLFISKINWPNESAGHRGNSSSSSRTQTLRACAMLPVLRLTGPRCTDRRIGAAGTIELAAVTHAQLIHSRLGVAPAPAAEMGSWSSPVFSVLVAQQVNRCWYLAKDSYDGCGRRSTWGGGDRPAETAGISELGMLREGASRFLAPVRPRRYPQG